MSEFYYYYCFCICRGNTETISVCLLRAKCVSVCHKATRAPTLSILAAAFGLLFSNCYCDTHKFNSYMWMCACVCVCCFSNPGFQETIIYNIQACWRVFAAQKQFFTNSPFNCWHFAWLHCTLIQHCIELTLVCNNNNVWQL